MKALVLKEPGVATVEEIAVPARGDGEVLLRVRMVGMCGSDLNTFRGTNPMVSYPRVLGHEVVGTILDPGDSSYEVGTNVTVSPYTICGVCAACRRQKPNACVNNQTLGVQRDGAATEVISVPARTIYSGDLALKSLCLVEPLTIGTHAVSRGRLTAQDIVAVLGCGGVGLGAISAAAFRGATVIAVDVDSDKLAVARLAGAKHTVNGKLENVHEALLAKTAGHGPDVIIEAIGSEQTFRMAVEEVASTGRVVYIGYAKEPVAYETKLFVQKEIDILGSRNALPVDFREVIAMLEAGNFPVEESISAIASLEDAPELLAKWSAAPEKYTKIMITLD